MNNTSIKSILSILLISSAVIFMNCTGKQGDPGPAGANGANATNGKDGSNGTDNAVYLDAISRGGITLSLDGKRPDGVAFQATLDFPYSSSEKTFSSAYRYMVNSDSSDEFYLKRYTGYLGFSGDYDYAYQWTRIYVDALGDTSISSELEVFASVTFPSEAKYFNLSGDFGYESYYDGEQGPYFDGDIRKPSFSGYSYDSLSGELKHTFSYIVPGNYNSSGYDLQVKMVTDANAYLQIANPSSESRYNFRKKASGRVAATSTPATVAKAEMKDMK